jgi:hypothetical protein
MDEEPKHRFSMCRFVGRMKESPFFSADTIAELVRHLEQLDGWVGTYNVYEIGPRGGTKRAGTIMKDETDGVTWKPRRGKR